MPTYQYACKSTKCGNAFELAQSFTDPDASECPVCHGPVRKVFSAVGVVFKGPGFYRTDSRSGNGSSGSSGRSHSSSSSSSSSDSGSGASAPASSPSSSTSSSSSESSSSGSTAKAASASA